MLDLIGKDITFGVCGSIAAYKAIDYVNRLTKMGANVTVILTKEAETFVTAETFQVLTKNRVITEKDFGKDVDSVTHILYGQKCDMMIVAPATANIIGKSANGIADDMLSSTIIACNKPLLFVPAMNSKMYDNPIVQKNMKRLIEVGYYIAEPVNGNLACGDMGKGKIADFETISAYVKREIGREEKTNEKSDKKINVLITAGGTSEPIDNVRKITNSSTGKLGYAIASELIKRQDICNIFYIKAQKAISPPSSEKIHIIEIETTKELQNAIVDVLKQNTINYCIHSMAVSDYYVETVTTAESIAADAETRSVLDAVKNPKGEFEHQTKISSNQDNLIVVMKQTPKIIGMIKEISPETHLFGFKLLDSVTSKELITVADKLRKKNKCDVVIANDLNNIRKGNHTALFVDDTIQEVHGKEEIAKEISNRIS